jgi:hypothetical protein
MESPTVDANGSGQADKPQNDLEFEEDEFRAIRQDMKKSRVHYKLALKFEICVFMELRKLAMKEAIAGMSLARIASLHLKHLIKIHKETPMDDPTKLNLTIIYLSMAKAFAERLGIDFLDTFDKIAEASSKVDISKLPTEPSDTRAKRCLSQLILDANSIMGKDKDRFDSERMAATMAYRDIVDATDSAITKFMKKRPMVAKLLVAHLITSAYSIFLASGKKDANAFKTRIVAKF